MEDLECGEFNSTGAGKVVGVSSPFSGLVDLPGRNGVPLPPMELESESINTIILDEVAEDPVKRCEFDELWSMDPASAKLKGDLSGCVRIIHIKGGHSPCIISCPAPYYATH